MKALSAGLLIVCAISALVGTSEAVCRWTWDCSNGYPCRQVQVCDDALDMPTIRPPEIPPISPPSIRPIPQPTIPPLGTKQCQPQYLCDTFGNCQWQTVCQ